MLALELMYSEKKYRGWLIIFMLKLNVKSYLDSALCICNCSTVIANHLSVPARTVTWADRLSGQHHDCNLVPVHTKASTSVKTTPLKHCLICVRQFKNWNKKRPDLYWIQLCDSLFEFTKSLSILGFAAVSHLLSQELSENKPFPLRAWRTCAKLLWHMGLSPVINSYFVWPNCSMLATLVILLKVTLLNMRGILPK